jgi:preprotein translocase subunit SecE
VLGVRVPPGLPLRKVMEKVITYVKHSKEEILKVIFPTKEQVRSAFFAVFVVVTIISLFLALVDATMSYSLSLIID